MFIEFQPDTSSQDLDNLRQQMAGLKSTLDEVSSLLFSHSRVAQVILAQQLRISLKF